MCTNSNAPHVSDDEIRAVTYSKIRAMNWNQYQFVPQRGDIIIFPSWLRHTVYAHYEPDCVRVSVAGNVDIVGE